MPTAGAGAGAATAFVVVVEDKTAIKEGTSPQQRRDPVRLLLLLTVPLNVDSSVAIVVAVAVDASL